MSLESTRATEPSLRVEPRSLSLDWCPAVADGQLLHEAKWVNLGGGHHITKPDYDLALLEKRGAVASREELMLKLWDSDEFVDDNTLTVNVNRLRKTLAEAGLGDCVKTHKGQGYSLDA